MSSAKSPEEVVWLDRVHQIPCVLCTHLGLRQATSTEAHHLKEGAGLSQRSQHCLTIALCGDHHTGPQGLHGLGTRGLYTRYKLDELDLLAFTITAVTATFLRNEHEREEGLGGEGPF